MYKFLSITAVAVICVISAASAEQWYMVTPSGKCRLGSEVDATMGFPPATREFSVASPEGARRIFQSLGDYRGMEPISAAHPDGATAVRGRFPGGVTDINLLYVRDLTRCQEIAATISRTK